MGKTPVHTIHDIVTPGAVPRRPHRPVQIASWNRTLKKDGYADFLLALFLEEEWLKKIILFLKKTISTWYIIFLLAGGPDPEIGLNYIRELFLSKKPADKHMYLHVTCATDTDLMKAVLKDVFEILVDINLKKLSTL